MAYKRNIDPSEPITHATCVNLRSKQMYVTGQVELARGEEGVEHYCWCNETQHCVGPDDVAVGRSECCPERECYRITR